MNSALPLVLRAAAFAADKHRDQRRKGEDATPYVNHCIGVALLLSEIGDVSDADVLAAALLHDTVEDTQTTNAELLALFGPRIAGLVGEVTDDKSLPKMKRKAMQIEHAPHLSLEAKLVKLADKIANIRDVSSSPPTDWSLERQREYFDWARSVVDALGDVNPKLQGLFNEQQRHRP